MRCVEGHAGEGKIRAVAESSSLGTDTPYHAFVGKGPVMLWYLNRCVVNPPSARGKGLGSQALQNMLAQLETTDCEVLVVTPGGYGGDPDDQDAFYTKNGFEAVWQDGEGGTLMIWIPKNKRTTPG